MFESKITSKGRITIPKNIRDFLKIDTAGTVVFIPLEDGKVLMTGKKIRHPGFSACCAADNRKKSLPQIK